MQSWIGSANRSANRRWRSVFFYQSSICEIWNGQ